MHTLVLALNPSIDVEWRVERVRWEEKNNVESERRWAGGKGINVARWLRFLGGQPRLLLPLGGASGQELASYLSVEKLPVAAVRLQGVTRANVIVSTAKQGQLRFNPFGPELSRAEWRQLLQLAERELRQADLAVFSGSLPRGLPVDAYARLLELAHRAGVKVLLDCDGAALAAAVRARPFLVKPNEDELANWRGQRLRTTGSLRRAALSLSKETGGWVLVSRGAKGAMLVNRCQGYAWSCPAPRVRPLNTVGAGDAMLAAVARGLALSLPPPDWLHFAVGVASRATQLPAGTLPRKN